MITKNILDDLVRLTFIAQKLDSVILEINKCLMKIADGGYDHTHIRISRDPFLVKTKSLVSKIDFEFKDGNNKYFDNLITINNPTDEDDTAVREYIRKYYTNANFEISSTHYDSDIGLSWHNALNEYKNANEKDAEPIDSNDNISIPAEVVVDEEKLKSANADNFKCWP